MTSERRGSLKVALLASDLPTVDAKSWDETKVLEQIEKGEVPPEVKTVIKSTFELFDVDKDGHISINEIKKMSMTFGMSSEDNETWELMSSLDTDGSGEIDYSEFESFVLRTPGLRNIIMSAIPDESDMEMIEAFRELDKNGDGFIDRDELRQLFQKFGDQMPDDSIVDEMIQNADKDGDGKINYSEYVNYMIGGSS